MRAVIVQDGAVARHGRQATAASSGPRARALTPAVLFVLGALLSAVTIRWGINPHDEGLVLQAGARISEGQLPYRDFYANYGPGQYFVAGGLDLLFGPSLLTWRVVRVALDATVAVLAYLLARREAPEPLALGAWLAVAGAMAFPSIPSPNPAAIALGLGALLLAGRRPALAGALAGLAVVFRVDVGVAAVAGAVLAAMPTGGWRAAARAAVVAAVVAVVLLAPVVLADPRDAWDQTLGFALDEQGLQRLPLPGLDPGTLQPNKVLDHLFPYVLLAGAALWAALAARSRAPLRDWAAGPLLLSGVGYLLARADEFHYIPLAAVLPVLLVTVAARERAAGRTATFAVACAVVALMALHFLDEKRIQALSPPPLATLDVDVADGVKAQTPDATAIAALCRMEGGVPSWTGERSRAWAKGLTRAAIFALKRSSARSSRSPAWWTKRGGRAFLPLRRLEPRGCAWRGTQLTRVKRCGVAPECSSRSSPARTRAGSPTWQPNRAWALRAERWSSSTRAAVARSSPLGTEPRSTSGSASTSARRASPSNSDSTSPCRQKLLSRRWMPSALSSHAWMAARSQRCWWAWAGQ